MNEKRLMPFTETILSELITYRNDPDGYTQMVFRNLIDLSFQMVTRMPNWDFPFIQIGDRGFMKYIEVVAGRDTWWDSEKEENIPYKKDGAYITGWIPV